MAEIKNPQEPTFPSKRKPDDANATDTQDPPNKAPKLATLDSNSTDDAVQEGAGNDDNELQNDVVDNDNGDDDDGEEEDDEEANGEAEVDRKGKGVMRDDKGKGKLIAEEEEDEDDDDDSDDDSDDSDEDGGGISGGDSDFSDDPLAEVDLNNILPSRTRRRTVHPGLHIADDAGNAAAAADDDDDDDSDV